MVCHGAAEFVVAELKIVRSKVDDAAAAASPTAFELHYTCTVTASGVSVKHGRRSSVTTTVETAGTCFRALGSHKLSSCP